MKIAVDAATISAFALVLIRATVFFFIAPPFSNRSIPTTVKAGLAASLSLAIAPHVQGANLSLDTGPFAAALITQAVVGLAMGLTMVVLMSAVQSAGALIDVFAGFSMASLYDPMSDNTTSLFGRFYQLLAITILFASNLHLLIVKGFTESFRLIPVDAFDPAIIAKVLTLNLGQLFVAAFEIAGPVVGCLFVSELSMGLIARAAPSLNIFSLAFPIRVGVAMLVVSLAIPLLAPAVHNIINMGLHSFLRT